jgi:hypothetical protein
MKQTCTKCKAEKDGSKFRERAASKSGLNYWCKECENTANKKRYTPKPREVILKDKEIKKIEAKKRMLKHRYGMTYDEYEQMYKIQNSCCAICLEKYPLGGRVGLYIDHDHKTGKVRGLLCNNCNSAIGKLKESREILERAVQYLDENK